MILKQHIFVNTHAQNSSGSFSEIKIFSIVTYQMFWYAYLHFWFICGLTKSNILGVKSRFGDPFVIAAFLYMQQLSHTIYFFPMGVYRLQSLMWLPLFWYFFRWYLPKLILIIIRSNNNFKFIVSARDDYIHNEGQEDFWIFNTGWKLNHPLLWNNSKLYMYKHDTIMTMDQNFSWFTFDINHSTLLLLSNQISFSLWSSNVGLSVLWKYQHTQTHSRFMNRGETLTVLIHAVSHIL